MPHVISFAPQPDDPVGPRRETMWVPTSGRWAPTWVLPAESGTGIAELPPCWLTQDLDAVDLPSLLRSVSDLLPRETATRPDWTSSRIP